MPDFVKTAVEAARIGGAIQKEHLGRALDVQYKAGGPINLVTDVDRKCEKAVLSFLRKAYPRHGLWGEESGRGRKAEFTWVVDPLDGTTNYAHGYPFFCCSVALLRDERPIAGAVFDPVKGEVFSAGKGEGAHLNGKRIRVSSVSRLEEALLATGFAYFVRENPYNLDNFRRFVLAAQGVRRDGSAALNLSYVAAGRFDGMWERGPEAWDMAAGVLLIQEAGGVVTDITGGPWRVDGQNMLVSNGRIHSQMLEILQDGPDERRWRKRAERKSRKPEEPAVVQQAITADLPLFAARVRTRKTR